MEEETVICPSCGREVPKTLYCIYCGAALFKAEETPEKAEEAVEKAEVGVEEVKEEVTKPSEIVTEEVQGGEVDPEIRSLMEDLKNYFIWKIKLVDVLCKGDVSEPVFTKLFEEYQSKINSLTQVRNQKIEQLREGFDKKKEELKEAKLKLEELRVRCAVGEIDRTELESRAPELEEKIRKLEAETSYVDAQLACLNNLLGGKTPKEIMELEKTARRCYESIKTLVDEGKISEKIAENLSKDLDAVLKIFDSMIGEKKREEEKLREELSTLEARYKVGEISISDFEKRKREILAKLEKIWE